MTAVESSNGLLGMAKVKTKKMETMKAIKFKESSAFQSLAPDELKTIHGGEESGEESGMIIYDCTCHYSIFNQGSFRNYLGSGLYSGSACQEECESYCSNISGAIFPMGIKTPRL